MLGLHTNTRHGFRLLAMLLAVVIAPLSSAWGFGTISFLGQHAEHQKITRWALEPFHLGKATLDAFAGTTWSFGAVGAPDSPFRGLVTFKPAHCDGGDYFDMPGYTQSAEQARHNLVLCRAWMFDHLNQALALAGELAPVSGGRPNTAGVMATPCKFDGERRGSAKCQVLDALGVAFHASQDFYAHTNWVDEAAPGPITVSNPVGLDRRGPAPWIDPGRQEPFPAGLITGCWEGAPEFLFCGHGTAHARIAHATLNKDTGSIDVFTHLVGGGDTPRGAIDANFSHAVQAAIYDTRAKWGWFEARTITLYGHARGQLILCRLKQDNAASCSS
jgi:hypothetical protein